MGTPAASGSSRGSNVGGHPRRWVPAAVVGAILHAVAGFYALAAVGLTSLPLVVIVVLAGGWLAGAALMVRRARRSPLLVLLVPLVYGFALWSVLLAGEVWWGWGG